MRAIRPGRGIAAALILLTTLAGCGGGGGSAANAPTRRPPDPTPVIWSSPSPTRPATSSPTSST